LVLIWLNQIERKKYKTMFIPIEDTLGGRGYTGTERIKYSIGWFVILVIIFAIFQ